MKSLVVYYTRTGNTKFVAETIAAELVSDMEEVVDLKKREGTLGYMSASKDATGGKLTEIAQQNVLQQITTSSLLELQFGTGAPPLLSKPTLQNTTWHAKRWLCFSRWMDD